MSGDADILQLHRGPVYPPPTGEAVRIWETAKKLSEFGTVWLGHPTDEERELEPGVRAVDTANPFLDRKATRIYAWNAAFGLSADNPLDRLQTRATVRRFERFGVDFDLVCCESPQMLRAGRELADYYDAPLLLNKHNAMFDLLDQQLGLRPVPGFIRRRAVANLKAFEQRGIDAADAVVFQSEDDREEFRLPDDTVVDVIPNGTDFEAIAAGGNPERLRNRLGIPATATVCLFIGSGNYEPNIIAIEKILEELAPALPDVAFVVVGTNPPETDRENVYTPGFVEELPDALSLADVAICPLTTGSGTKLKMMDYLAAGLPIVTTSVGAQGIPLEDGHDALIRDSRAGFVEAIRTLDESASLRASLGAEAETLGEKFAWSSLMEGYEPILRELLGRADARPRSPPTRR